GPPPPAASAGVPPARSWRHRFRVLSVAAAREALRDRGLLLAVLLLPLVLAGAVVGLARLLAPHEPAATAWVLPGTCAAGLVVLALTGTAGRMLPLRARGAVLLLAVSPAGRSAALLAAAPVRVALALVQLLLTALVCAAAGELAPGGPGAVAGLVLTDVLGALLAVGAGALAGGLLRAVESARGLLVLATGASLLLGGVLVPLSAFPVAVADVLGLTPTALLADALRAGLTGAPAAHPLPLTWAVLAVAGALAWAGTVASLRLGARRCRVPDRPAPAPGATEVDVPELLGR
ncbi:ABC transporter permease, partial [Kineococcus rubinsiae]|uniref:ABC transporter permease n=1 Tax=Kineococcus rubinsiae TaxID=2609562 RepID=UPI001430013F